jgi:hypothetical protein
MRGQTDGDESKVYGREESSEENRCKDRSSESHEGLEREHQEGAGEEAGRQGIEGQEEEQLRATGEKARTTACGLYVAVTAPRISAGGSLLTASP